MKSKRLLSAMALGAAALIALAGCSADAGGTASGTDGSSAAGPGNGDKKDVTIAVFNGWAEGEAASYVWKQVLEDKGYDVTLKPADAGPVFLGLADKSYDVTFDVWLPNTHKTYWEKYGDKLEKLDTWYKNAPLTVAVNKDAPIDSLDQLAAHAEDFDDTIIGIEPGAGLTEVMKKSVIPDYGLGKMTFQTSSTAAMLAALKKATNDHQNIVVTLWKPHWAYAAFPVKDLKDPKGALGEPDGINVVARDGFSADYPTLTGWLKNFTWDPDSLADLEEDMFRPADGADAPDASQYPAIVQKWLGEHEDFEHSLTSQS